MPQFTFYRDPDFDTARRQMIVDWTDLKFDDEENPGIKKIPLLAPGTYTQDASKLELDCFRVH